MSKPNTLKIDDVEYVRKDSVAEPEIKGDIKIVVLQRGWICVGLFEKNGNHCILHKSATIRRWGTKNGLGELAKNGPRTETKLDKNYGIVEFDILTVVLSISCEESKWANVL